MSKNPVVQDALWVNEKAEHVRVKEENIHRAANEIFHNVGDNWDESNAANLWCESTLNPNSRKKDQRWIVAWIFTVSTLNFSFWSDAGPDDRFTVAYKGNRYTGYWSLLAALHRALEEDNIPILDVQWQKSCTLEDLEYVFRSETDEKIPLLNERLQVLHEIGNILTDQYSGSFVNVIKEADQKALKLVDIVTDRFSSYDDYAIYNGRKIVIRKRAQILVAEIWAALQGKGLGTFTDIDEVSMFADYRVPQMLYELGLLEYSKDLLDKLNRGVLLPNKSQEEVEIRAASIVCVEHLVQYLRQQFNMKSAKALLVDFWLWDTAKVREPQATVPVHRTRSIYY